MPVRGGAARVPVLSADQVTMWAAARRLGTRALGPYRALLDAGARVRLPAVPEVPDGEQQQEGWT
jgi:maleate isomerase